MDDDDEAEQEGDRRGEQHHCARVTGRQMKCKVGAHRGRRDSGRRRAPAFSASEAKIGLTMQNRPAIT